jgi:hypothetical protein
MRFVTHRGAPGRKDDARRRTVQELAPAAAFARPVVHAELRDVVGVRPRRVTGAVLWDLLADASRDAVVDTWLETRRDGGVLAAGLCRAEVPMPVEVLCRVPPAVDVRRYADCVRGGPHLPPDLTTLARIRRAASTIALHPPGPGCEVDSTTPVDVRATGYEVSSRSGGDDPSGPLCSVDWSVGNRWTPRAPSFRL